MTVHMIRIYADPPAGMTVEEVDSVVQSWVDSHTEWVDDEVTHEIRETGSVETGERWLMGDFRFVIQDDKTTLLDDIESSLKNNVRWMRLGYHQCSNDGESFECSWSAADTREFRPGQIPAEVQTFQ